MDEPKSLRVGCEDCLTVEFTSPTGREDTDLQVMLAISGAESLPRIYETEHSGVWSRDWRPPRCDEGSEVGVSICRIMMRSLELFGEDRGLNVRRLPADDAVPPDTLPDKQNSA